MSTAKPLTGPWGRRLWVVVATLTAIGLIGPVIFLWLYGSGVGNDIQTALTPPPSVQALAVPQGPTPGCAVRPGSL